MQKKEITFTLNGKKVWVEVKPYEKLLDVLRDKLGVKSPKYGCGRGECGACSVLLDGKAIRSCIVYAIEVDGHDVITVEGLQANGLTDLQKSFLAHNSFQCGFCAPGMIIQATELLNENPHPDEEEIREYIAGNLCRCTGYNPIVEAIMDVAKKK
ncbi:MAG: (2Fe-2S)-binding protein [Caldisericum sp.]|jgi:carbon-monoxide dehydrogenase small subunit|nr:(2Fe-2S)-binding protein [Caldisericum sp.]